MGVRRYYLRQATDSDYDFLYQIRVSCLKEYVEATWGWDEAFQRAYFARNFNPEKSQIIVVGDVSIGELSVQDNEDELFLSGIYIQPAYQRQGLGTIIIQDLLKQAQARKVPLKLQVMKVNPARSLYERLGFKIVETSETHHMMVSRQQTPVDS